MAALFELPLEGNDQANLQVKEAAFELFKGEEHFLELEAG